jgi:hypothetical protein
MIRGEDDFFSVRTDGLVRLVLVAGAAWPKEDILEDCRYFKKQSQEWGNN